MKKLYIVKYNTGDWETWDINIFTTFDKDTAQKYVDKFNLILKKWQDYYSQFGDEDGCLKEGVDEYPVYKNYYLLMELNKCFFKEIEIR